MNWINKILELLDIGFVKIKNLSLFKYKKVSKNNKNYKVNGDLSVENNYNPKLTEVIELLDRQEMRMIAQLKKEYEIEAREIGIQNTHKFMAILQEVLKQNKLQLDIGKFSTPDFQEIFNLGLKGAYIQGDRVSFDTLARLISRRGTTDDTDLQTLTIDEAIVVVPKLRKKHISFLTFVNLLKNMSLPNISKLSDYEYSCSLFSDIIPDLKEITAWDVQYLESQRCISISSFGTENFIKFMKEKYKDSPLKGFSDEELNNQIEISPNLKIMVEIYNNEDLVIPRLRVTILGQMIASMNTQKYSPKSTNFDNYIK